MRRLLLYFLAGLFVIGMSLPAVATHIQEPTTPITGLDLRIWDYNDFASIVDCSTVSDVTFETLRVDAFVHAAGAPSEHFRVTALVEQLLAAGPPKIVQRAVWAHQNAPPHAATVLTVGWYGFWFEQWNLSQHLGLWRVTVSLTGDQSGNVFTQTCRFRKV